MLPYTRKRRNESRCVDLRRAEASMWRASRNSPSWTYDDKCKGNIDSDTVRNSVVEEPSKRVDLKQQHDLVRWVTARVLDQK